MTNKKSSKRSPFSFPVSRIIGLSIGVVAFLLPYVVTFDGLSPAGHRVFSIFLLAIGTFMLQHLIKIARRNGIAGFTAEVLRTNRPMQTVFGKGNVGTRTKIQEDVISYELDFA